MRRSERCLDIEVPARCDGIDYALLQAETFFRTCGVGEPSRLLLVLNELLINAAEHGSGYDGRVRSRLVARQRSFVLEVRDDGAGFEVSQTAHVALPGDPRYRSGYALINALAQSVEFEDDGSTVRAVVLREAPFTVQNQDGMKEGTDEYESSG